MNASAISATPRPQRQPQQLRGHARVNAILDAGDRLLRQGGEAALTMHGVAAEAQTSIGSLYHFFADKRSLLLALFERHHATLESIAATIGQLADRTWQDADAERLVGLLMQPFLDYLSTQPQFLLLISPERSDLHTLEQSPLRNTLHELFMHILTLRLPAASEAQKRAYTATLFGLPLGLVTQLAAGYDEALRQQVLQKEIPRALTAYVRAIESTGKAG